MSIRLGLNISTSPRSLFAAFTAPAIAKLLFSDDEAGFFYDFDDWSTLFQDEAGTTPVTAPEQGVALALDKRLGLGLGPELVTNGTFDTDTSGWTEAGTPVVSVSDGIVSVSQVGTGAGIFQDYALQSGQTAEVTFRARVVGSGVPTANSGIWTMTTANLTTGRRIQNLTSEFQTYTVKVLGSGTVARIYITPQSETVTVEVDFVSAKVLAGNHATQATTAARPLTVVHPDGGVRNLLDRSEGPYNTSPWGISGDTSIAATGLPDAFGTNNAILVIHGGGQRGVFEYNSGKVDADGGTASIYAKVPEGNSPQQAYLLGFNGVPQDKYLFTVTDQWQRFDAIIDTSEAGGNRFYGVDFRNTDITEIELCFPQVEQGSLTPYQRRVNFLNVTEAGKRSIRRLYFNGTSHFMTTPTITPNTDKAQVFAGVRKLREGATGAILETSSNTDNNNGTLGLFAPTAVSTNSILTRSRGTGIQNASANNSFPSPISGVVVGLSDIAAPFVTQRINGQQIQEDTANQGTGNYLAYQTFIGARAGTSLFFNGFIDQLITRFGATPDETTIGKVEKYNSTKVPELVAASEVTWNASTDTYTQNLVGLGR